MLWMGGKVEKRTGKRVGKRIVEDVLITWKSPHIIKKSRSDSVQLPA